MDGGEVELVGSIQLICWTDFMNASIVCDAWPALRQTYGYFSDDADHCNSASSQ